jgi:hypothetical protein
MMLSEAAIQLSDQQNGSKPVAYHRFLGAFFATTKIMAKKFGFNENVQPSSDSDREAFEKLTNILDLTIENSVDLLGSVAECDEGVLEMVKNSGSYVAGTRAEPLIVDTLELFEGREILVERYGNPHISCEPAKEKTNVSIKIPESRLSLNMFALQYHLQLLMQKLAELENKPAKDQSNAIFLACCKHTASDFVRVLDAIMDLAEDMKAVEALQLRNELMSVDKVAAEIHLIDRMVWGRLIPGDLLKTHLNRPDTVKPVQDYFQYLVSLAMSECVSCGDARECAETIVFLTHIADRLVERYGNYNASAAIVRAINEEPVKLKWGDSFNLLPGTIKKTISRLAMCFDAENNYGQGWAQVKKHPKPIPPIFMLTDMIRRVPSLNLSEDLDKLLKKVIAWCNQKSLKSQRPDIQHWLLTRPFDQSWEKTIESVKEPSPPTQPESEEHEPEPINIVIPDSLLGIPDDPLDPIHNDQYEQIFGVHAK